MIAKQDFDRIEGATAYDDSGEKIGRIGQLYTDDETGEATWVTVSTGLFGLSESFAPLRGAEFDGNDIRLKYDKETVKNAPRIDKDQHLDLDEQRDLYRHYGFGSRGEMGDAGNPESTHDWTGKQRSRRGTADAGDKEHAMTLSEERLKAGKERVEVGRARLRKYTTTHTEKVDVPVTKEKLVVERTPASGHATKAPIRDSGEKVEEVTLREERPVVEKETVPVEDVRVGKERVTDTEQVSAKVRKERADVDIEQGHDRGRDKSRDERTGRADRESGRSGRNEV
jgi:uncharacterized protein (TIGR02271 family)